MRRLVEVELTRLRWRRAVQLLALTAVLLTVLIGALATWGTRPLSADERAEIDRQVQAEADRPYVRQTLRECLESPSMYIDPATGLDTDDPVAVRRACEQAVLPQPEWFGGRPTLDLGTQAEEAGLALAVVLVGVALLVGTTFAGHDWGTGSITNQLLVEPRRGRLWTAKALAAGLGGLALAAVLMGVFWGGLRLVAATRGLEVGGDEHAAVWVLTWRTVLLAVGVAVGSYALTMLLRGTVAALGVVFVAVAVLPVVLVLVTGSDDGFTLTPAGNVAAVLDDGLVTYDDLGQSEVLTAAEGSVYLLVLLLLIVVPSILAFRRGDVG